MRRRQVLAALSAGTPVAGAGCIAAPTSDPPTSDCDETPATVLPADPCDDAGFVRFDPSFDDVTYGTANGLRLRQSVDRVERGDSITFSLVNETTEDRATGSAEKYCLQAYTEDGWRGIRGASGELRFVDETHVHGNGTAFEWTFAMSTLALTTVTRRVCPDLRRGRYRFVYFGVDAPLGACFDVV